MLGEPNQDGIILDLACGAGCGTAPGCTTFLRMWSTINRNIMDAAWETLLEAAGGSPYQAWGMLLQFRVDDRGSISEIVSCRIPSETERAEIEAQALDEFAGRTRAYLSQFSGGML